ncbi:hypothetical protein HK101_006373 [Irineochytrium annulatum]|nr:hypothetical protein HK101_006373 [Irineochytrium annulatum]
MKKLGSSPQHRLDLLKNLASSLILHGRIKTTFAKAKFLQRRADKIIEWAKVVFADSPAATQAAAAGLLNASGALALPSSIGYERPPPAAPLDDIFPFPAAGREKQAVAKPRRWEILTPPSEERLKEMAVERIKAATFMHELVFSKLELLSARFHNRHGGFTRLIRNGYHRPGTDRARVAIIEYLNNPADTIRVLAELKRDKVAHDLAQVQSLRYDIERLELQHPETGERLVHQRVTPRADVRNKKVKALAHRENGLQKIMKKFDRSIEMHGPAREAETRRLEVMAGRKRQHDNAVLARLQEEYDMLESRDERRAFFKRMSEEPVSDDPLLTDAAAVVAKKVKVVVLGPDKKTLMWKSVVPVTTVATVGSQPKKGARIEGDSIVVDAEGAEVGKAGEDSEPVAKPKPKGIFQRMNPMGFWPKFK